MVASIPNDVFQFSTWTALQKGFNTGQPRAADLTTHGTDGIGVFENGNLMILTDSKAYAITDNSEATAAESHERLCFAMVTVFDPLRIIKSDQTTAIGFVALKDLLSSTDILPSVGGANSVLPFKVKGTFANITLATNDRSESRHISNAKGTIFGYKIPTWMEGISGPILHCHFVGEHEGLEENFGGRLVSFEATVDVVIGVGKCGRFHLGFPQGDDWEAVDIA